MPDPKTKRHHNQDSPLMSGARTEPGEQSRANFKPADKPLAVYDDLELRDREKLVNKLIDRLKDL
ncbi:MAG TPA: hypothetical protein VN452_04465 [Longilinea sp.]|nr:hypothetical protein [Longilinea sp.]